MTQRVFTDEETSVRVVCRNHRGEVAVRRIRPLSVRFGVSPWHAEGPQWFLECVDVDRGETRSFAMKDILQWGREGG